LISGNTIIGGMAGVATDGYAYQGNDYNQGILVQNNQFINSYYAFMNGGAGVDRIVNLICQNNTALNCHNFASGYGWGTNVVFIGNVGQGFPDSSQMSGQWFNDEASDSFPAHWDYSISNTSLTNLASYSQGRLHSLCADSPQGVFLLDTSHPERIPSGAELVLTNACTYPVSIYTASINLPGRPLMLPSGSSVICRWSNASWAAIPAPAPSPPTDLRAYHP
jgi:hypothetical protein